MTQQYVPDLDPGRPSWVFLSLKTKSETDKPTTEKWIITSWRLGVGNTDQLVRNVHFGDTERDNPVSALGDELAAYQNENRLLITPTTTTLHCLRSNLFRHHKERETTADGRVIESATRPTLHGYRHLPIKETLDDHFASANHIISKHVDSWESHQWESLPIEVHPSELWDIARTIIPLLPIDIGQGQRL